MLQHTNDYQRMNNCAQIGHVVGQIFAFAVVVELDLSGVLALDLFENVVQELFDADGCRVEMPHVVDCVLAHGHVVNEVVLERLRALQIDGLRLHF